MVKLVLILAIVAACVLNVGAAAAGSNLIALTDDNFNTVVLEREGPILVEFFSPYCGHCVAFAPELEKVANDLHTLMPVGQVDITKHRSMVPKYNINGVPAVFLFGQDKQQPKRYTGRHEQRSVVQFVLSNVNHSYVALTSPATALPRFLANRDDPAALPRIVYFADANSQEPPVQFASAAHAWKDSALFGFVRGDDFVSSWKLQYGIDSLPALVAFSSVDLSETVVSETWAAEAKVDMTTFIYRYTGSLTDEAQLNDFCMEVGARSSLYYDSHRGFGFGLNRTSFNVVFLLLVVGAGVGFVYWSRRLNRHKAVLPTTYPSSASHRNFAD